MNKGTIFRTIARIAFSIFTSLCLWQVAIEELSKLLNTPWLVAACAVVIVLCGIIVDTITTYYNNDFTEVAAQHTAEMRQHKKELEDNYIGDRFFTEPIDPEYEVEEDGGEEDE